MTGPASPITHLAAGHDDPLRPNPHDPPTDPTPR
jgi:hypothetical protein